MVSLQHDFPTTDPGPGAGAGAADVFRLLGEPTRLRIVLDLAEEGELNVTQFCERLGQPQPAVSHHLALLKNGGLLSQRRAGKYNFYSIRRDRFQPISDLLGTVNAGSSVA